MKCRNDKCSNEAKGRSKYCSDSCKTVTNRNKKRNTESVTSESVTPEHVEACEASMVKHCKASYFGALAENKPPEVAPGSPNSGGTIAEYRADLPSVETVPASAAQPEPVRSRVGGCRVAIPGDEDYTGCVVDGKAVKSEPIPVKDMTRIQLDQAIRAYPHNEWVNSPEHSELMHRLNTMNVVRLEAEGYHVPAWKVSA